MPVAPPAPLPGAVREGHRGLERRGHAVDVAPFARQAERQKHRLDALDRQRVPLDAPRGLEDAPERASLVDAEKRRRTRDVVVRQRVDERLRGAQSSGQRQPIEVSGQLRFRGALNPRDSSSEEVSRSRDASNTFPRNPSPTASLTNDSARRACADVSGVPPSTRRRRPRSSCTEAGACRDGDAGGAGGAGRRRGRGGPLLGCARRIRGEDSESRRGIVDASRFRARCRVGWRLLGGLQKRGGRTRGLAGSLDRLGGRAHAPPPVDGRLGVRARRESRRACVSSQRGVQKRPTVMKKKMQQTTALTFSRRRTSPSSSARRPPARTAAAGASPARRRSFSRAILTPPRISPRRRAPGVPPGPSHPRRGPRRTRRTETPYDFLVSTRRPPAPRARDAPPFFEAGDSEDTDTSRRTPPTNPPPPNTEVMSDCFP